MKSPKQRERNEATKLLSGVMKAARKAKGLKQEDAAIRVGCSLEFYSRIERARALPSLVMLRRIARCLDIDIGDIGDLS